MSTSEYRKARMAAMPPCTWSKGCKRKVVHLTSMLCLNHYGQTPTGRDLVLRRKYGIALGEFDELMQIQNGVCGICESSVSLDRNGNQARLCVDHDHKTGVVRGLLCSTCNSALGLFKDDARLLTRALMWIGQAELPDEKFNWIIERETSGAI